MPLSQGALHQGHLSLAKAAMEYCDKVVLSIFVNPSQFAPHEDLNKYPRTLESDLSLLSTLRKRHLMTPDASGVDCVLVPQVEQLYPRGIPLDVSQQKGAFVEVRGLSHQMYFLSHLGKAK